MSLTLSFVVLGLVQCLSIPSFAQVTLPTPTPPPPGPRPVEPVNVQSLCAATTCLTGTVCRVIRRCRAEARRCNPVAACLPCVPQGADAVCNANRYISVVLVGNPRRHENLKPHFCNLGVPNDESGCPVGSVCARSEHSEFLGTCCYGKPPLGVILPVPLPIINRDTKCIPSKLCGEKECPEGTTCLPDKPKSDCENRLPYTCQAIVKRGSCPPVPFATAEFCMRIRDRVARSCENDSDCDGIKKCCATICNGRACLSPAIILKGK